jgi:hypothetical protein
MMSIQDMKLYVMNLSAFTLSFTNIDMVLKIVLLLITILYTAHKWYLMYEKNK